MKKRVTRISPEMVILVLFATFLLVGFGMLSLRGNLVTKESRERIDEEDSSFFEPKPPPRGDGKTEEVTEFQLLRSDAGDDVTVDIILLNPLQDVGDKLVFRVDMSTHSVDLGSLQLADYAYLRNSKGDEITTNFNWNVQDSTSHHPWGYLEAPLPSESFLDKAEFIELKLRDMIDIPEMAFVWEAEFLKF